MARTLALLEGLITRRSATPEDAGCQALIADRLKAVGFDCETLVFGVETTDVVAYVSASVVLMLATLAACLIPARRAASVDPVRALRLE